MKRNFNSKLSQNYHNIPRSFVREILNVANQPNMISFAGGLPNPAFFPVEKLEESAQRVLKQHGKAVLQYAGSKGYLPLRQWIADRYNTKYGLNLSPENILITNGSQQAIDMVSKLFLNPGDGVILEQPSYLGAIQALSAYSPTFHEVELMHDGPNLEQVEQHMTRTNAKFMYAIPNFQNPSGICYSLEKRQKLAEMLIRHDQFLLEDDPYNEIQFSGEVLPPVYKFAPDRVIWTGSFSKMIAPGLRTGWLVLPDVLVPCIDKVKQSTDLHSNNLTQYMLHDFLSHNNIDAHLDVIKTAYRQQCQHMTALLERELPKGVSATNPCGGLFLWLTLPEELNSEELVQPSLEKGVIFVPGRSFYTNGRGTQNIRMNFSNASLTQIEKGMKLLGQVMAEQLAQKSFKSVERNEIQSVSV